MGDGGKEDRWRPDSYGLGERVHQGQHDADMSCWRHVHIREHRLESGLQCDDTNIALFCGRRVSVDTDRCGSGFTPRRLRRSATLQGMNESTSWRALLRQRLCHRGIKPLLQGEKDKMSQIRCIVASRFRLPSGSRAKSLSDWSDSSDLSDEATVALRHICVIYALARQPRVLYSVSQNVSAERRLDQ